MVGSGGDETGDTGCGCDGNEIHSGNVKMDPIDIITRTALDLAEAARFACNKGDITNAKTQTNTLRIYLVQKLTKYETGTLRRRSRECLSRPMVNRL